MKTFLHTKNLVVVVFILMLGVAGCSSSSDSSDTGNSNNSDFPCATAKITIESGEASQTLIDNYNRECS